MKNLIIAGTLVLSSASSFAASLMITDLENNTAAFPPALEQVRERLVFEGLTYSFSKGDIKSLKDNGKSICLTIDSHSKMMELKENIERGLVSPNGSDVPSSIKVQAIYSCN